MEDEAAATPIVIRRARLSPWMLGLSLLSVIVATTVATRRDERVVSFGRTTLSDAVFTDAKFRFADLSNASVSRTTFRVSDLRDARFDRSIGKELKFDRACLQRTTWDGADIVSLSLDGSDVSDVDFQRAANLEVSSAKGVFYSKKTKWPGGVAPVSLTEAPPGAQSPCR